MKKHTVLAVIDGKRDEHEKQFQHLLNCPHQPDQAEFDRLLHKFKERLSRAERFDLISERIRKRKYADTLEQKALLAIVEGRQEDAEYYQRLLQRRQKRGFRVVPYTHGVSPVEIKKPGETPAPTGMEFSRLG